MTVYIKTKEHVPTSEVFTFEGMQKEYDSYLEHAKMYIQGIIDLSYKNIEFQKKQTFEDWWTKEDKHKWEDGINYLIKMYNKRINNLQEILLGSDKEIIDYYLGIIGIEFEEVCVQE